MARLELSEHVVVPKNISSSTRKRMSARNSTVLKVVEKVTAIRNQTDALMVVSTDYTSSTKERLTTMVNIELSEHACAMKHTSSLTKKRMSARNSSVLRVVEQATALRNQIDALKYRVHTD